ncbi:MAG: phage tail protein [Acidimicrobiales bacterium]|nr:phage tail protein [Acidimicrobiales bacterium]
MALTHVTKTFAVEDAKIAQLTADPAGGSATYGSSIDVPGIKQVTISGDVNNVELRGDNQLLDSDSLLTNIKVQIGFAKFSFDLLPVFVGGTTADAGTTPNQTVTHEIVNSSRFNYFKLMAKTPTGGGDVTTGDVLFTIHKMKLSSFPELGLAEEAFKLYTVDAVAMPLLATGNKWLTVQLRETAAAIT